MKHLLVIIKSVKTNKPFEHTGLTIKLSMLHMKPQRLLQNKIT